MCARAGVASSGLADGSTGIDIVGDILGGRQETRRNDAVRVQELFPLLSLSPWPLHVILHGGTQHGDMQEISGQEPKRSTGRAALAWASCGFVSPSGPRKAVTGALCARRERGRPAALCTRLETANSVRCWVPSQEQRRRKWSVFAAGTGV